MTLYFMDSHANCEQARVGGYQWIDFSQIDWFIAENKRHPTPPLSCIFPCQNLNDALKGKIFGEKHEDICSPPP